MNKWLKKILQYLSLLALDLSAYYVAVFIAVIIRRTVVDLFIPGLPTFTFTLSYTASMYWVPIVIVVFFFFAGLYRTRYPFWEETRTLVKSLTLSLFFIAVTFYLLRQHVNVLRLFFVLLWVSSLFIFPLFRYWGKKLLYKLGPWKENVIILGAGEMALATVKGITHEEHLGYKILGFLDDDPRQTGKTLEINGKSYKIYGEIANFTEIVSELNVDTVFIAVPYPPEVLRNLINHVYKYVRRVIMIPDLQGVSIFNSELHYLFREKLFMIKIHNSLNSPTNLVIKRIFDLVLSTLIFSIISPLFLVFAVLIKITSPGPVFFIQERIGKNGKIFKALKFRSMYIDAEEKLKEILKKDKKAKEHFEKFWKLKEDPRITKIGKFLRNTSLDELPQIINVFKGEMSLIGPRPYLPSELEQIGEPFNIISSVVPGITGLWQVSGRSDTDYNFRIQTDIWYVQNWNLWLDIIILIRTPWEVIRGKGAY